MKVVVEKSIIEKIQVAAQEAKRGDKAIEEILLSPDEVVKLKREIFFMLPKKYWFSDDLPAGLKLLGVPVRADDSVVNVADRG